MRQHHPAWRAARTGGIDQAGQSARWNEVGLGGDIVKTCLVVGEAGEGGRDHAALGEVIEADQKIERSGRDDLAGELSGRHHRHARAAIL